MDSDRKLETTSPGAGTPASAEALLETPDYVWFKQAMLKKSGIDLNQYKQAQMHRRLLGLVERLGCKDFTEYYARLDAKPEEYAVFLDRMTINVSELFRNPEKWKELEEVILPDMLRAKRPLKIWSAGCSYGAEPYTLAIILDKLSPGMKHTIDATDLDRTILERAKAGRFTQMDIKQIKPADVSRYFNEFPGAGGMAELEMRFEVKEEIRRRVDFRQQNLLADRFQEGYDLICCRNVVIYFTDDAKDKLYKRFASSLKQSGVLFVGGTERIFGYQDIGFTMPVPFFYRMSASAITAAA
jgi:chemotaxis protein methyltransferase CheR